ncbi:unnamed protein product [Rotaria sp. Silwood1]|nr:unnamed protein product [Rotaria sp. Silwood1]CAF3420895.1 unnamed protein product [Rotaria sp. Silwood1]CAF3422842.1 unnamed protein product [Rotaria sp. Silwood1]CAF4606429.1 unnamed protein product [Rotaria sp. Silwood1]CAF4630774.1 unnamed protein product [Rotaria sp. Silwood1]
MNSVTSIANNQTKTNNQLYIDANYRENDTIILLYNITTNYSYFITFRSFGHEQLKFGLFLSTNKTEENSIEIFYQYHTIESFNLFIICFHFILQLDDLDIQCKDLRIIKDDHITSNLSQDFLPSYNPLFVPMMYGLSILMLLPVIIQHHRHKKAQLLQRRNELRRLSITISQDNRNSQQNLTNNILSKIVKNGNINYENIPVDIELISLRSTKTMLDDVDDNVNSTFALQTLQPFMHKYDDNDIDKQSDVNAHDCIAHLLDNTPWNTLYIDEPLTTSSSRQPVVRDCTTAIKEQHVPTIISFHNDDNHNRKFTIESNKHSTINLEMINRVFFESDV